MYSVVDIIWCWGFFVAPTPDQVRGRLYNYCCSFVTSFTQTPCSTGFSSVPTQSSSTRTLSPGFKKIPRGRPTPEGVPVAITSPGSSVMRRLRYSINSAIFEKQIRLRGCLVHACTLRRQLTGYRAGDTVRLMQKGCFKFLSPFARARDRLPVGEKWCLNFLY